MMSICKTYRFEAAHSLPLYNGNCKQLHGHSYKLEVEVEGQIKLIRGESDDGMIMDFEMLDNIVGIVLLGLDHTYLNENTWMSVPRTTAELLCNSIAAWLKDCIDVPGGDYPEQHERRLVRVRLWETEKAYAEWRVS